MPSLSKFSTNNFELLKELKQQRELMQLFIEYTPAAVAMFDTNMCYLAASRRWYIDYDIDEQNIIGRSHYEIFPEIGDKWKQDHIRTLNGEVLKDNAEAFPRADGSTDYIRWENRPWYHADGSIGGIVMFTELVTDEVLAKQTLQKTEKRYRLLVENLPDKAVIMFDKDLRYTVASGSILEDIGFSSDKMLGKTPYDILSEETIKIIVPQYQRVLSGEVFNYFMEVNDNSYDLQFIPVNEQDQTTGGMILITNITNQHRYEKALRESVQRFKAIFNQIFQFVGLMTPEGIMIEANDTALAFGNITREDIADKPFWEMVWWSYSEKSIENLKKLILQAAQGEFVREELVVQGGDGSFITIDFSIKPMKDDNGDVVLLIPEGRDITESKLDKEKLEALNHQMSQSLEELFQAHSKLQLSEARFAGVLATAHDAIISVDENHNVIMFNQGAEKIFGYDENEIIGESIFKLIPKRLFNTQQDYVNEVEDSIDYNDISTADMSELKGFHKSGRDFFIEASLSQLEIQDESIFTVVVRDITPQKEAEQALKLSMDELQEANKEIQSFTYIVSHDMRAPLINLKGFSNILENSVARLTNLTQNLKAQLRDNEVRDYDSIVEEDMPTALGFINTAVDRLDQYTTAILNLSRAGRRSMMYERVDINNTIVQIVDSLAVQIDDKNIQIDMDLLPEITTDRLAVDQILMNIITNAVKYTSLNRDNIIRIYNQEDKESYIFNIEDNGRGIAESDYERVFAPFRRAGQQNEEGEGMGLAYVQTLVKKLGGRIWFTSELDKGSTFSFSLPKSVKAGKYAT